MLAIFLTPFIIIQNYTGRDQSNNYIILPNAFGENFSNYLPVLAFTSTTLVTSHFHGKIFTVLKDQTYQAWPIFKRGERTLTRRQIQIHVETSFFVEEEEEVEEIAVVLLATVLLLLCKLPTGPQCQK